VNRALFVALAILEVVAARLVPTAAPVHSRGQRTVPRDVAIDWDVLGRRRYHSRREERDEPAFLAGRLAFTPSAGLYTFERPGAITPVIAGAVSACAKGVVATRGAR